MSTSLAKKPQIIQNFLDTHDIKSRVVELPGSTRTAFDAATTLNCQIAQITKSLIFKTKGNEQPILVLASGANRVQEPILANLLGKSSEKKCIR